MKKNSIYALMSAIALAGSVGFSSCSSEDDVIDNPNYNPETNSVKTEFTISLPNYVDASTRQEDAIVQVSGAEFRGMQNMVLIPFKGDTTTPLNNKIFTLSDITAFDLSTQKAKVYKELDVPLTTSRFIFYGQAKVTGNEFKNGKLNPPSFALVEGVAPASDTYNFTLEKIQPDYDNTSDTKGKAICAYIKAIRETSGITSGQLQSLLTNFQPIAASSASIEAAVQQLWNQVKDYSDADGSGLVEASIEGSDNEYATISETGIVTLTPNTNLTGYPENLNLPDGAVSIDWSDIANPKINTGETLNAAAITKYVYPAALYYRANSNIGVSQNENVSTTYGEAAWSTITGSNDKYTWDGSVGASTHSIALKDQIQYAVGRLDLSVKAEAATLADREGKTITVDGAGFPISAVLIGGQKDVGFDFTPNGTNTHTIYDNVMNGTVAAKGGAVEGVNRTLVLETATDAKTVNIAVEMTNNTGVAFRGKDGTVPAGGKFYLVGTLNLDAASGVTHPEPENPRTKIFEQDYITTAIFTIKQGTFKADPTPDTNTTGLGAAYNVIPDLTVSQLEVAFSVDLEWTPGITFEVDL